MNKLIPLLSFSILLLVPMGIQDIFADHTAPYIGTDGHCNRGLNPPGPGVDYSNCQLQSAPFGFSADLSNADLSFTDLRFANLFNTNLQGADLTGAWIQFVNINTPSPILSPFGGVVCGTGTTESAPDGSGIKTCSPDLDVICSTGTIQDGFTCIGQAMSSMIGGTLLETNSVSLLVGAIGVNPVITGLVGITIAGVAGQAVWFVHRRKKNNS